MFGLLPSMQEGTLSDMLGVAHTRPTSSTSWRAASLPTFPVRSATPNTIKHSTGGFRGDGRRCVSPAGNLVPVNERVSSLASRMRNMCLGAKEDQTGEAAPLVRSRGGLKSTRAATACRGRNTSTPNDGIAVATRLERPLRMAARTALTNWYREQQMLFRATGRSGMERGLPLVANAPPWAQIETNVNAILNNGQQFAQWQHRQLKSSVPSLQCAPTVWMSVSNPHGRNQSEQAAALIHASLQFMMFVNTERAPPVIRQKTLHADQPRKRMFSFSRHVYNGKDCVGYFEESKHILVGCNGHWFRCDVFDSNGAVASTWEIASFLDHIKRDAMAMSKPHVDPAFTSIPPAELIKLRAKMAAQCLTNQRCLADADSALFTVVLDAAERNLHTPCVASDQVWCGKPISVFVDDWGNAAVRGECLFVDESSTRAYVEFISDMAYSETVEPPPPPEVETVHVVKPKTLEAVQVGKKTVMKEVQEKLNITVPSRTPPDAPQLLRFYLPEETGGGTIARGLPVPTVHSVGDVTTRYEHVLHAALVLALMEFRSVDKLGSRPASPASLNTTATPTKATTVASTSPARAAPKLPVVHHADFTAVREPRVFPAVTPSVANAVLMLRDQKKFGTSDSHIERAWATAVYSMEQAVTSHPFVSDLRALHELGYLEAPRAGEGSPIDVATATTVRLTAGVNEMEFGGWSAAVPDSTTMGDLLLCYTPMPQHAALLPSNVSMAHGYNVSACFKSTPAQYAAYRVSFVARSAASVEGDIGASQDHRGAVEELAERFEEAVEYLNGCCERNPKLSIAPGKWFRCMPQ